MTWDQAQREALARATNSEFMKFAIELRHSLFPSHIRMVNHDKDVSLLLEATAPVDASTTQNFTATAFRFKEPKVGNQPDPTVRIELDGVSGTLQPFLSAAIRSGEPVLSTIRGFMYDVDAETEVQRLRVLHLELRRATTNMTTISATFGYTNPANQTFPSVKYSAQTHPGLE